MLGWALAGLAERRRDLPSRADRADRREAGRPIEEGSAGGQACAGDQFNGGAEAQSGGAAHEKRRQVARGVAVLIAPDKRSVSVAPKQFGPVHISVLCGVGKSWGVQCDEGRRNWGIQLELEFEWDEEKRLSNIKERGVDLRDAA